jgi:phosphonate metabolism-associated iron-containing alcohol dehydrogenase
LNYIKNSISEIKLDNQVLFGLDSLPKLILEKQFMNVIIVTSNGFVQRKTVSGIVSSLDGVKIHLIANVSANPKIEEIEKQFDEVQNLAPDVLIALGGGSAIDTAKALVRRFSLPPQMDLMEYLKDPKSLTLKSTIPIVAVPTTSGSGSEVTPFASIWSQALSKKFSVAGFDLVPSAVVLDSNLTHTLPREVTISSGLDTVSHALESLWNRNCSEESSYFALKSLEQSIKSLPRLVKELNHSESRDHMMLSSFLGGMAIARTQTALAHSISYPLTAHLGIPHGIACSFALPQILIFNAQVDPDKFERLANNLGFKNIEEFSNGLQNLLNLVNVREVLLKYSATKEKIFDLSNQMMDPMRAENNLREVSEHSIKLILKISLDKLKIN